MKKTMVYILALSLALTMLMAGCGERTDNKTDAVPTQTPLPQNTVLPETMMPDPEDGVVDDVDGVITETEKEIQNEKNRIEAGVNDLTKNNGMEKNAVKNSGKGTVGKTGGTETINGVNP